MQDYIFLFVLTFVWLCFAVVQDVRTREISNWLNFSLLSIALVYRGFVSIVSRDASFFLWGIFGTLFFVGCAYALYYGRAFAGGDAKLLMALGPILPFEKLDDLMTLGLGFIFALFVAGAVYSLVWTLTLVLRHRKKFSSSFNIYLSKSRSLVKASLVVGLILGVILSFFDISSGILFALLVWAFPFLFVYGKVVESCFFIKQVSASRLTEGDWLVYPVKVGSKTVQPSVHGLTIKELALLQHTRKPVTIKEGIPFSPAFLLAFLFMVFFVLL